MAKYKMTLFARFFIFLIIAVPVAYIAAAYINGQDGLQQVKSLFQSKKDQSEMTTPSPSVSQDSTLSLSKDQLLQQKSDSIQLLRKQLEDCQKK